MSDKKANFFFVKNFVILWLFRAPQKLKIFVGESPQDPGVPTFNFHRPRSRHTRAGGYEVPRRDKHTHRHSRAGGNQVPRREISFP